VIENAWGFSGTVFEGRSSVPGLRAPEARSQAPGDRRRMSSARGGRSYEERARGTCLFERDCVCASSLPRPASALPRASGLLVRGRSSDSVPIPPFLTHETQARMAQRFSGARPAGPRAPGWRSPVRGARESKEGCAPSVASWKTAAKCRFKGLFGDGARFLDCAPPKRGGRPEKLFKKIPGVSQKTHLPQAIRLR
jgi:hypothetical protein